MFETTTSDSEEPLQAGGGTSTDPSIGAAVHLLFMDLP